VAEPSESGQDSLVAKVIFPLEQLKSPFDDFWPTLEKVRRVFADHGKRQLQSLARRHPAVFLEGFLTEHSLILIE
jgi:hypothetical protein